MAYCSIFIYSLWLSGYGKGKYKEMGEAFLAGVSIIAVMLNIYFGSNLMFLREPSSIPVPLLHSLYNAAPWGYTILVFLVYLVIPYFTTAYLNRFITYGNSEDYINLKNA